MGLLLSQGELSLSIPVHLYLYDEDCMCSQSTSTDHSTDLTPIMSEQPVVVARKPGSLGACDLSRSLQGIGPIKATGANEISSIRGCRSSLEECTRRFFRMLQSAAARRVCKPAVQSTVNTLTVRGTFGASAQHVLARNTMLRLCHIAQTFITLMCKGNEVMLPGIRMLIAER